MELFSPIQDVDAMCKHCPIVARAPVFSEVFLNADNCFTVSSLAPQPT